MNCPHCNYEPQINEFDYCDEPGRFFTLGIEMKQEANPYNKYDNDEREPVLGCPNCGALFIYRRYVK